MAERHAHDEDNAFEEKATPAMHGPAEAPYDQHIRDNIEAFRSFMQLASQTHNAFCDLPGVTRIAIVVSEHRMEIDVTDNTDAVRAKLIELNYPLDRVTINLVRDPCDTASVGAWEM